MSATGFAALNLPEPLQRALDDVGYETPSPIQAQIIPHVLAGSDVLGQAQTGTGKTAAFALPILARLQDDKKLPQVLVLTPTRELAIQVAEAFQKYARYLTGFNVLPIYGGADLRGQLRQLQRGAQVVVGTPGRVMDHMRRGSLDLSELQTLVLDEADEMLRMGFIDDVEWILEKTPPKRQIALFSATMPKVIHRIAKRYLNEPKEVAIAAEGMTSDAIRQRVWMTAGVHKLDALTRILEVEDFDGIIIFVRTRLATTELADKLSARGYAAAPLNGDVPQKLREKTVENLKRGHLDILVATDVAARGLDVERISHVINYDIPYDVEAYVHRIGRTGRAGREGDAILFAANRERRLLRAIENATGKTIERMQLPTAAEVTDKQMGRFKQRISETLDTAELDMYRKVVEDYQSEHGVPVIDIASALAAMAQGKKPKAASAGSGEKSRADKPPKGERKEFSRSDKPARAERKEYSKSDKPARAERKEYSKADKPAGAERKEYSKPDMPAKTERKEHSKSDKPAGAERKERPDGERAIPPPEHDMERFRIEVGHTHGTKPANIVGAIANEAEIDAQHIGRIEIYDDYSTVDLPSGMPKELFSHLRSVWVSGQRLQMSRTGGDSGGKKRAARRGPPGKKQDKRRPKN